MVCVRDERLEGGSGWVACGCAGEVLGGCACLGGGGVCSGAMNVGLRESVWPEGVRRQLSWRQPEISGRTAPSLRRPCQPHSLPGHIPCLASIEPPPSPLKTPRQPAAVDSGQRESAQVGGSGDREEASGSRATAVLPIASACLCSQKACWGADWDHQASGEAVPRCSPEQQENVRTVGACGSALSGAALQKSRGFFPWRPAKHTKCHTSHHIQLSRA